MEEAINSFLESDFEMSNLYLSEKRDVSEHEEVELLLEGYRLDLQEIQLSNRTMLAQVLEVNLSITVAFDATAKHKVLLKLKVTNLLIVNV
jgi:hypothetical protein